MTARHLLICSGLAVWMNCRAQVQVLEKSEPADGRGHRLEVPLQVWLSQPEIQVWRETPSLSLMEAIRRVRADLDDRGYVLEEDYRIDSVGFKGFVDFDREVQKERRFYRFSITWRVAVGKGQETQRTTTSCAVLMDGSIWWSRDQRGEGVRFPDKRSNPKGSVEPFAGGRSN